MDFRTFPLKCALNVFVEVKQIMSFCINRCSYVIEDENKQEEQAAGLYCDSQALYKVTAFLWEFTPDPNAFPVLLKAEPFLQAPTGTWALFKRMADTCGWNMNSHSNVNVCILVIVPSPLVWLFLLAASGIPLCQSALLILAALLCSRNEPGFGAQEYYI